jgi:hypothetical protein
MNVFYDKEKAKRAFARAEERSQGEEDAKRKREFGYGIPNGAGESTPEETRMKRMWASQIYADALANVTFEDFKRFYRFAHSDQNPLVPMFIEDPNGQYNPKTGKIKRIQIRKPQYSVKGKGHEIDDINAWLKINGREGDPKKKRSASGPEEPKDPLKGRTKEGMKVELIKKEKKEEPKDDKKDKKDGKDGKDGKD